MGVGVGEGTLFARKEGRSTDLECKTLTRPLKSFHSPAFPSPCKPPSSPQLAPQLQLEAHGLVWGGGRCHKHWARGAEGGHTFHKAHDSYTRNTTWCSLRAQTDLSAVSLDFVVSRVFPLAQKGCGSLRDITTVLSALFPASYQLQHQQLQGQGPSQTSAPSRCPADQRLLV